VPNSTDIVTAVSLRLRDPQNTAYPVALLNRLISQCQRLLNVNQRLIIRTTALTNTANQVLYQVTAIASDIARVEMVRQDQRDLFDIPWESLQHQDRRWMRRVGARLEYFSRIGNDVLVVAPATPTPVNITVVYTSVPPDVTGAPGDVSISAEYVPLLQDMVEATALLRSRRFTEAKAPIERIKATILSHRTPSVDDFLPT
jgi:hypothetical protein